MSEHLLQVDKAGRLISIFRVGSGKSNTLFTALSFEQAQAKGFEAFAKELGENLIFDSPELRSLLLE